MNDPNPGTDRSSLADSVAAWTPPWARSAPSVPGPADAGSVHDAGDEPAEDADASGTEGAESPAADPVAVTGPAEVRGSAEPGSVTYTGSPAAPLAEDGDSLEPHAAERVASPEAVPAGDVDGVEPESAGDVDDTGPAGGAVDPAPESAEDADEPGARSATAEDGAVEYAAAPVAEDGAGSTTASVDGIGNVGTVADAPDEAGSDEAGSDEAGSDEAGSDEAGNGEAGSVAASADTGAGDLDAAETGAVARPEGVDVPVVDAGAGDVDAAEAGTVAAETGTVGESEGVDIRGTDAGAGDVDAAETGAVAGSEGVDVPGADAGAGNVDAPEIGTVDPADSGPVEGADSAAVGEAAADGAGSDDVPKPGADGDAGPAALPELDDPDVLRAALEAILMVVDEPVPEVMLAQVLERPTGTVTAALRALAESYTVERRGFELRQAAGGWRIYTRADFAPYVERFVLDGQQVRLTQAALETLAVVAYKQPVSRGRVSAIRGVNCDGVMRTLVTRGLIEECGAEPDSGAYLYRTTVLFLERMGINSVDELPELAPFLPDDLPEEA
ncbi:hypothetical protein GCM10022220_67340 [Actinocatenispora rupis]|uniref:Segregation and condensation protein B n=1 Tax=Actinocatenispora rupis TaxID=519421 RepID=A0A8J3J8B1_9ACTN|nr:hypothetical protein Aru02nite_28860 [Actinocatenispora rupis]